MLQKAVSIAFKNATFNLAGHGFIDIRIIMCSEAGQKLITMSASVIWKKIPAYCCALSKTTDSVYIRRR